VSDDQTKVMIYFTKEQLEEMYQWYLLVGEEYSLEDFEIEIGEKIRSTLIELFGGFN